MIRLAAFALGCLLPCAAPAQTDAADAALRAAQVLQDAATSLAEAEGARDRVEALTDTVQAYETGLLALRQGLRQVVLREQAILAVFDAERDRLARLLGVLQSIQSAPGPLLLLHPEGPVGTARAGMIVADVTPAIAAEAAGLRRQLEELQALRAVQADAEARLSAGLEDVQRARAALSQAIAERRTLPAPFAMDTDAMRVLLDGAMTLDDIAAVLASQPSVAPSDMPDFAAARGRLAMPLSGTVLRRFGEPDAAGITRPGLVLASRPRALVTSPWPATVRYAGPLPDYGNVIILEPEGDYLVVLAGVGEVFVRPGEFLTAGGPVGLMPGTPPDGEDLILASGEGGGAILSETLYLEVRENGQPVDPAGWFDVE